MSTAASADGPSDRLVRQLGGLAAQIEVHDLRIHVRRPGDGRRVAEVVRDLSHDVGDRPAGPSRGGGRVGAGEGHGRADSGVPGPEILGGHVHATGRTQIVVDIRGPHVAPLAGTVAVRQQPVAAPAVSLECAHGGDDGRVV